MNGTIAVVSGTFIDTDRANSTMLAIVKERISSIFDRYDINSYTLDSDGFSALMNDPHDAIRMCLEHRAMLKQLTHKQHPKGLDSRVSIGLGSAETDSLDINDSNIASVRASLGLDDLVSRNGRIGVSTGNIDVDALLGTALRLLDRVIASWSSSQAAAMEYALQGLTQHQIADILHITQPSVNNRLKLAHWNEIEHVIDVWEGLTLQKVDVEYQY